MTPTIATIKPRPTAEALCNHCGNTFTRRKDQINRHKHNYCNVTCQMAYRHQSTQACIIGDKFGYNTKGALRRIRAMLKIDSELKCVGCSCDDVRILEINHKNGGGGKELHSFKEGQVYVKASRFYDDINTGRRKTNDLNLLCRVCNAMHYVETRGIKGFKVTYNPS